MKKYLIIGAAVQGLILVERTIRGITKKYLKGLKEGNDKLRYLRFGFWFVWGAIINILVWPITIIFEIFNIKNGK
jgi:hypothetical protein